MVSSEGTILNFQMISKSVGWKVICQVVVTFTGFFSDPVLCHLLLSLNLWGQDEIKIAAFSIVRQDVSNLLFSRQVPSAVFVFVGCAPGNDSLRAVANKQ